MALVETMIFTAQVYQSDWSDECEQGPGIDCLFETAGPLLLLIGAGVAAFYGLGLLIVGIGKLRDRLRHKAPAADSRATPSPSAITPERVAQRKAGQTPATRPGTVHRSLPPNLTRPDVPPKLRRR